MRLQSASYWEEAADASNIAGSPVWDATYGFGGNGAGPNNCVPNGPFSNLSLVFNDNFQASQPYCLARSFNQASFQRAQQSDVNDCFNEGNWNSASSCYENWVHIAGHDGVGRVVSPS